MIINVVFEQGEIIDALSFLIAVVIPTPSSTVRFYHFFPLSVQPPLMESEDIYQCRNLGFTVEDGPKLHFLQSPYFLFLA